MSATSSVSFEQQSDAHKEHHVFPSEIAVGVIIGRIGEFFDFFVYGIASALVFPKLFFSFADPLTALFYSFSIFSLGFLARPLGAYAFRLIHDRFGRSVKLTSALFILGTATVAMAFLPSYEAAGASAIWALIGLRLAQGLSLGGAWDGLPSLLAVTSPAHKRGWYAMISQIGAPMGFIVAIGMFAYLYSTVPAEEFLSWGWRFAFFTAFAINVVTLFARLRMAVTPEYEELFEESELTPSPIGELLRTRRTEIALGALAPLASYALFHLVTIYPLSWLLVKPELFSMSDLLWLQLAGGFICLVTMIISGRLADRIGREKMLYIGAIMIVLFTLPAPFLGDTAWGANAFIPLGFALLGFSLAQSSGALNSVFAPQERYSGALITHEVSWLLGAAFAPLVALWLGSTFGEGAVALYLLSGAVATLVALQLHSRRQKAA